VGLRGEAPGAALLAVGTAFLWFGLKAAEQGNYIGTAVGVCCGFACYLLYGLLKRWQVLRLLRLG